MKNINELWYANLKWYDYPVVDGQHRAYRINSPKPFKVRHEDGTFTLAYSYGDYHFTYSKDELMNKRAENAQKAAKNKERAELLKYFEALSNEELKQIINNRRG